MEPSPWSRAGPDVQRYRRLYVRRRDGPPCGYIGGRKDGNGIAVDGSGNAYVTGNKFHRVELPVAVGPDLTHNGRYSAFVAKVNANGGLVYRGYIGGSDGDGMRRE